MERWLTRELFVELDRYKRLMERYGFRTDFDEMYESLGFAIFVNLHIYPMSCITSLLTISLVAELATGPFIERRKQNKYLLRLYLRNLRRRKRYYDKIRS